MINLHRHTFMLKYKLIGTTTASQLHNVLHCLCKQMMDVNKYFFWAISYCGITRDVTSGSQMVFVQYSGIFQLRQRSRCVLSIEMRKTAKDTFKLW